MAGAGWVMRLHGIEAGAGPTVAILHGLFGSARNFATIQRRLAAHYRVLALDLRNHGESPRAAGMDYATLAEDVRETLAARDALPAAVIGHSMGGKVAMRLALAAPAAVSRLAVCDIAPVPYPSHGHGATVAAMQALPLSPALTRAGAEAALAAAVPSAPLRQFLLHSLRFGAAPSWRLGLAEIAQAMPAIESWEAPAAATYAGPTLFLTGGRSEYVRADDRPLIRAVFPHARFVTLKKAGHWLHADDPEGFLAAISAFLAPLRAEGA
jgi:pimeloyl-ACP methyl ester carboxylesterase